MKKYLFLQLKRAGGIFPFVLGVTLVLLLGVSVVLGAMLQSNEEREDNKKINIGVSGDLDNDFLKLGLGAFQAFDDTKYTLELIQYSEEEAERALERGEVLAYIVIPDEFMENALGGEIEPVRFVTTAAANDIVTMLKNEILSVVTDMVVAAQQGSYGLYDVVLDKTGDHSLAGKTDDEAAIGYFELIINRNDLLKVEEVGVGANLTTSNYYICSMLIFFLLLMGLPYAALYCRRDNSLIALLSSKGVSCFKIQLAEYLCHLASLLVLLILILGGISVADGVFALGIFKGTTGCPFIHILPTLIMISAFNIMVFELASNLVAGVLCHFFASLSLCYISGCFYPIHAFPKVVQDISSVLPTGLAREQIASFFTGKGAFLPTLAVLLYAVLFFVVAAIFKRIKVMRHTGGVS